jgi:hypothetical protein
MRKIIVSEFMSFDGVIQAPGGADEDTDGGFPHGGWTQPYRHDEIGEHFSRTMSECDTFLLGVKSGRSTLRRGNRCRRVIHSPMRVSSRARQRQATLPGRPADQSAPHRIQTVSIRVVLMRYEPNRR